MVPITTNMLPIVSFLLTSGLVIAASQSDEVTSLPGLDAKLNFRHYSGYLNGGVKQSQMHYWLFESQRSPSTDPLVLWLNGGPGCSSLLGALAEHGPLTLTNDQQVVLNPYAWNTQANILYLESPAGVGFSFNVDGDYATGDNATAEQNFQALVSFLGKFPEYTDRDFYITGESYGGIYVPTLSKLVQSRKFPSNFRGFAIGNGFLDAQLNFATELYFLHYHGVIDTPTWNMLEGVCCPDGSNLIDGKYCDFSHPNSAYCAQVVEAQMAKIKKMPLNLYDLYDVCSPTSGSGFDFPVLHPESIDRARFLGPVGRLEENPPCLNFDYMVSWLNRDDVKQALHISPLALPWSPCSAEINRKYVTEYTTMLPVVKDLLDGGLKGMIYNGDVDAMCNYLADEIFSDKVGGQVVKEYQPWMVDGQIAGMVKFYPSMAFVTVRGAGHTVPSYKPKQAQTMFNTFLEYKGDLIGQL